MTYKGVRIDEDPFLWYLYETVVANVSQHKVGLAKAALYDLAGSGGWDDICEYCPKHRYEHGGSDHYFISEEQ